jgi:hypothetical protein
VSLEFLIVGLLGSNFMWTCRYIAAFWRSILTPFSAILRAGGGDSAGIVGIMRISNLILFTVGGQNKCINFILEVYVLEVKLLQIKLL